MKPLHFSKIHTEKYRQVFSFPLIISFSFFITIIITEVLRFELALRWHLQMCRIMRQISPVMILVQRGSYLTGFDWLNISGNYFSNDFSFSLLSSCRISRRARLTFLLLWMCPRRWEEGKRPPESFLVESRGGRKKNKQFLFIIWLYPRPFAFMLLWIWLIILHYFISWILYKYLHLPFIIKCL